MIPTWIYCRCCGNDVEIVGKGATARLRKHNRVTQYSSNPRKPDEKETCPGSKASALALLIERAEADHDRAAQEEESARDDRNRATRRLNLARRSLEETAAQLDRLRKIKAGAR